MEFYKSNTHRRLISSCLNSQYFKIFLTLPKDDGVKRNIQSYLGVVLTKSEKYSIGYHRRLFKFIYTLNNKSMKQLREEIKKRKTLKHRKINYTRKGVTNTYCCRLNLVEYFIETNTRPYYDYDLDNLQNFITFTKGTRAMPSIRIINILARIEEKPKQFCKHVEEDIDCF